MPRKLRLSSKKKWERTRRSKKMKEVVSPVPSNLFVTTTVDEPLVPTPPPVPDTTDEPSPNQTMLDQSLPASQTVTDTTKVCLSDLHASLKLPSNSWLIKVLILPPASKSANWVLKLPLRDSLL